MCEMIFLADTQLNITNSILSFAVVEAIIEVFFVHYCPFCFIVSEFANQNIIESFIVS